MLEHQTHPQRFSHFWQVFEHQAPSPKHQTITLLGYEAMGYEVLKLEEHKEKRKKKNQKCQLSGGVQSLALLILHIARHSMDWEPTT